jgi:hypothetical protein
MLILEQRLCNYDASFFFGRLVKYPSLELAPEPPMAWTKDYVRRLVDQLAASSERGSGASITPEAANLILAALRSSHRWLDAAFPAQAFDGFQFEAIDNQNLPLEVFATTPDEDIAHAMHCGGKETVVSPEHCSEGDDELRQDSRFGRQTRAPSRFKSCARVQSACPPPATTLKRR